MGSRGSARVRGRAAAAGWAARTTMAYAQQTPPLRCGKYAGSFSTVQDSAGLGYGEDVSLLGVAGSGGDDAVRLAGCV